MISNPYCFDKNKRAQRLFNFITYNVEYMSRFFYGLYTLLVTVIFLERWQINEVRIKI